MLLPYGVCAVGVCAVGGLRGWRFARFAFGGWRFAFGGWRLAFGGLRLAFGGLHLAVCVWRFTLCSLLLVVSG